jgi:hypothetical protein
MAREAYNFRGAHEGQMSSNEPPMDEAPTGPEPASRYACPMCKADRFETLAPALYRCGGCSFSFTDLARYVKTAPPAGKA